MILILETLTSVFSEIIFILIVSYDVSSIHWPKWLAIGNIVEL